MLTSPPWRRVWDPRQALTRELVGNDSSVVFGCAPLNVANLIGEMKVLAIDPALARSTPDGSSGGGHGTLHQVIWRSSGRRLSLLRSHCHSWLPERVLMRTPSRASRALVAISFLSVRYPAASPAFSLRSIVARVKAALVARRQPTFPHSAPKEKGHLGGSIEGVVLSRPLRLPPVRHIVKLTMSRSLTYGR